MRLWIQASALTLSLPVFAFGSGIGTRQTLECYIETKTGRDEHREYLPTKRYRKREASYKTTSGSLIFRARMKDGSLTWLSIYDENSGAGNSSRNPGGHISDSVSLRSDGATVTFGCVGY